MFCIWYVDEQLKSHGEFIGLQSLDSTTVPNIICTIEDIRHSIKALYSHAAVQESVKANL